MTERGDDRGPSDHDVPDRPDDEGVTAMGDVDHESPDGTGADRVFQRGPPGGEDEE